MYGMSKAVTESELEIVETTTWAIADGRKNTQGGSGWITLFQNDPS